jgi:hypothetical protein
MIGMQADWENNRVWPQEVMSKLFHQSGHCRSTGRVHIGACSLKLQEIRYRWSVKVMKCEFELGNEEKCGCERCSTKLVTVNSYERLLRE